MRAASTGRKIEFRPGELAIAPAPSGEQTLERLLDVCLETVSTSRSMQRVGTPPTRGVLRVPLCAQRLEALESRKALLPQKPENSFSLGLNWTTSVIISSC
jgi:hypothetical protein